MVVSKSVTSIRSERRGLGERRRYHERRERDVVGGEVDAEEGAEEDEI